MFAVLDSARLAQKSHQVVALHCRALMATTRMTTTTTKRRRLIRLHINRRAHIQSQFDSSAAVIKTLPSQPVRRESDRTVFALPAIHDEKKFKALIHGDLTVG